MESGIQQLVDMVLHQSSLVTPPLTVLYQGATPAQARAALRRYSDVMEAAERIFDGAFDHITDDAATTSASSAGPIREPERCRATTRLVVCPLSRALSGRFLHSYRHQRRRTTLLMTRSEVKTTATVCRSPDTTFACLPFP